MDFKWTLSRPGIALEFETGSIAEAVGLMQEEGSKISEVFGFTMGGANQGVVGTGEPTGEPSGEPTGEPSGEPVKTRKPRASKVEAVAPPPLPVPAVPVSAAAPTVPTPSTTAATLPPNELAPNSNGIPAFLDATLPAPPVAPAPPPVGVLGPKVVAKLEQHREGKADGGQALADWLAAAGLTIPGKTFDEAVRVVLMTSDEKLRGVAEAFGVQ